MLKDGLRCSTEDRLKEIVLTEERVMQYAARMSAMMSQAVEAAHKTCECTQKKDL